MRFTQYAPSFVTPELSVGAQAGLYHLDENWGVPLDPGRFSRVSDKELLRLPNIGKRRLAEVRRWHESFGFEAA